MTRPRLATLLLVAAGLLAAPLAAPLAAQVDTTATPVDSVVVTPEADVAVVPGAEETRQLPISPRTAFIRSMVLPGWGQAAFDSYVRGGIFFAGWLGNWYMNIRNYSRLGDARDRLGLREEEVARVVADSLMRQGVPPDSIPRRTAAAVAADTLVVELGSLVESREQQREDWIAWTIFWVLASGIDGYVTAHLHDFPASIDLEPNQDRSVSVRIEVPWPRRPGARP